MLKTFNYNAVGSLTGGENTFMAKRKGIGTGGIILGVAIVLVAAGFASGSLNIGQGAGDTVETKDATLNLAASPLGSSTKKATTAYATFADGTVVSKSLSSGQFTAWSVFTNKDAVTVKAFDSDYYPIDYEVGFDGSTQLNKEIKVAEIATASDVSLEARETSGSSDNDDTVDIAAGGQATIDSLRANVDTQDLYWNPGRIYVELPSDTNVSVKMPNNEEVAVPDSAPSAVDKAFRAYSPSTGENTFEEFAQYDSNQIVLEGDDSNDPSETVTFYVDDVQAYQSSETGAIQYGVEDDSDSNLGLAEQSLSVTVN